MSNTPAPFGQPAGTGGAAPGVPGPPAWQTGSGSGGLNPEPAPSGRSKLPIVIGLVIEVSGAVLPKDAQDADDVAVLFTDDGVSSAGCLQRFEDSSDGSDGLAGIAFLGSSEPARNFSSWFGNFVVGDEDQDPKIDDEQSFASGIIYSGCTDVQCSAWWNDEENDVAFGVQLNSDEVEASDAVTILMKALPTLVANLAGR